MIYGKPKIILIILFFIIIFLVFGSVFLWKKPAYEKIINNLEETQTIIVYNLITNSKKKFDITDSNDIKKIINILSDASIEKSEWEYATSDLYKLEFKNSNNVKIIECYINSHVNNPIRIKYKSYIYSLKLDQKTSLKNTVENILN